MLKNYAPVYRLSTLLERLRGSVAFHKLLRRNAEEPMLRGFRAVLDSIIRDGPDHGFNHTAELAKRFGERPQLETDAEILTALDLLDDSLINELEKEGIVRVPPERKNLYEQESLFGPKVSAAFPSCERDIRKAGSCYALGQEDACVHHLMLVLERGLNALAFKVSVTYERTNWQNIIEQVAKKVKSLPGSTEKDFYLEVNAQFGFLKDAYRNHAEHVRDDHYDMPKALSILNHVRDFMLAVEKGGLSE